MPTAQVLSIKLVTGEPAPALEVPTVAGSSWQLAAQKPQHYTMILFYRGLHCPICKEQLNELDQKLGDFAKLGVEVIAISGDQKERAQASKQDWNLQNLQLGYGLPVEAMHQWGLYISKGAFEKEPSLFNEPAVFLIKPDQTVAYTVINSGPFGRPPLDDLLSGIQFMLENNYPTRGTEA